MFVIHFYRSSLALIISPLLCKSTIPW